MKRLHRWILLSTTALLLSPAGALAARSEDTAITAIYASTANGYHRQRGKDGKFRPEKYIVVNGGRQNSGYRDTSLDALPFDKVLATVAGPLRAQNYLPARNLSEAKLVLVLHWGLTTGIESGNYSDSMIQTAGAINNASVARQAFAAAGSASGLNRYNGAMKTSPEAALLNAAVAEMEMTIAMNNAYNRMRDSNNVKNAAIIGYHDEYAKALDVPMPGFSRSIIEEIEEDRYFVVLQAYDIENFARKDQRRLLWETRFSVRERGHRFDTLLATMTKNASKYFGQESGRLLRESVPVGRVDVGTPTVVETSATK